jgi:hypothetical protein
MAPLVQLPFLQTANFSKIRSVCLDMAADCLPPELKLEAENTMAKTELLYPQNWGAINFTQNEYSGPRTIEKIKSWGQFRSYQLNNTANLAHLAHFLGKWTGLAVLSSW